MFINPTSSKLYPNLNYCSKRHYMEKWRLAAEAGAAQIPGVASSPQKRPSDEVGGPSTAITEGSVGHLPQKKRKVEVEMPRSEMKKKRGKPIDPTTGLEDFDVFFRDAESIDTVTASTNSAVPPAPPVAPPIAPPSSLPPAPPIAPPTASPPIKIKKKDGKWSASALHSDDQSYDLGASFDTPELATLALGAFRSTLANESRAAGGRISEPMVTQARLMARQAVSAAGHGDDQKI